MIFFQQSSRRTLPQLINRTNSSIINKPTSTTSSQILSYSHTSYRSAHTVRVILTKDIPDKNQYAGETLTVKAGYARNYLVPKKMALYATPMNFQRVGIEDPELQKTAALLKEKKNNNNNTTTAESKEKEEDAKAADFLKYYLRNKTLKIWRNVDVVNITGGSDSKNMNMDNAPIYPGFVDHKNVREKLSKQLKIDLDDHERVQIMPTPVSFALLDEDESLMDSLLEQMDSLDDNDVDNDKEKKDGDGSESGVGECQVKLKALGEYLVKIHLRGDHAVGLRLNVLRR